jgi:hypothetical protein
MLYLGIDQRARQLTVSLRKELPFNSIYTCPFVPFPNRSKNGPKDDS